MNNNNRTYLFLVFIQLFSGCFTDIPKSNTIHSASREESKRTNFYVGEYNLLSINESCPFYDSISFDCWSEFAATTQNNFFFFPNRVKLDFYNFYLKINNETCKGNGGVEFKLTDKNDWESTICIMEPKLGLYFQIDKNINLDNVRIKIKRNNDSCIYRLIKSE
jgi:hypothetical protein